MNNATIKQLRAFVSVVDSGNFAEAYVLLHLPQSALSIAIKNVEQGIDDKLLFVLLKPRCLHRKENSFTLL